ncbi:hypothetical protein MNBD_GAMMA24-2521 [hydrothermal vent metagenome]|uniref:Transposase n=1 Tax=hydrothermal vent metagenome TaxID=652676 RepID=A0A3B1B6W1_9ZZZZ
MRAKFNQSFKVQAVEKALSRSGNTSLGEVAANLGVGYSIHQKWLAQSRSQELEPRTPCNPMSKEKRPQDWGLEEKLDMVITCGTRDEAGIGELCREKDIYPHHLKQWKKEFAQGTTTTVKAHHQAEARQLKSELRDLKLFTQATDSA